MERVGIDLGGTAIKAGVIGDDGTVVARTTAKPGFERGKDAVLDTIAGLYRELGGEGPVGVGLPGLLDRAEGVLRESPNLGGFHDVPVRDALRQRLGLEEGEVILENDANAAAVGELWLGGGRGERNALVVTLGTGVGGGLILDGKLFVGEGLAGEVGHLCVDPRAPLCGSGVPGCLESFASATAARRRAGEASLPAGDPGNLELLCERARSGSAAEAELLDEIGADLGRGLSQVVTLLDVRCFVFGGGFAAALDTLEAGVRRGLVERGFGTERISTVRLVRAKLGASAGWIGAARLAMA